MTIYRNRGSGNCLNGIASGGVGTGVGAYTCNGTNTYQNWTDRGAALFCVGLSRCVDGNPSGSIYLDVCNNSTFQDWRHIGYTLRSEYTGLCLDNPSGNTVSGKVCSDATTQEWIPI